MYHARKPIGVDVRYTLCGYLDSEVRRRSQVEFREAIPDSRTRKTEPLGNFMLGEAFGSEDAELSFITLGRGHGSPSLV
jgi:hypothetical protein